MSLSLAYSLIFQASTQVTTFSPGDNAARSDLRELAEASRTAVKTEVSSNGHIGFTYLCHYGVVRRFGPLWKP